MNLNYLANEDGTITLNEPSREFIIKAFSLMGTAEIAGIILEALEDEGLMDLYERISFAEIIQKNREREMEAGLWDLEN